MIDFSRNADTPVMTHAEGPVLPEQRFRRLLLIGLDGATFNVLDPLMRRGRMPHLRDLIRQGARGVLESTRPPITPAAWTTFMTGKGPGRHGIIDFLKYDPVENRLSFNNHIEIREKTIWEILSEKGLRVGSINVPMTFPPRKVNGFMISGFDTPSVDLEFTYPRELKQEILRRYPDYTHEKKWMRRPFGGDALFRENLDYICQSFDRGCELAEYCGGRFGWDVMMVLFKLVDNLQHKTWKYLDPRTAHLYPGRAAWTVDCFARLDEAIGRLAELARKNDATLMLMSDHGHGSLEGKAQPNLLLRRWGYLVLRSGMARLRTRGNWIWRRLFDHPNGSPAMINHDVDRELAVDWSRTRACVLHAGIYGFLYLNLRGRQPGGSVDPAQYDRLRDEIRDRLLAAKCRDPQGRVIPIYPEVHRTEELYGCAREEHPWLPDLMLVPQPGLAVVKKIRGLTPVRWLSLRRMEGTHRVEGVFVAAGPGIAANPEVSARIADLTPTMLAGLGLTVPADMEGQVIQDIFEDPLPVVFEPPGAREVEEAEQPVLTSAQEAALTSRLSDLGYLE
jgi:predicted AlkP superfamily phosphohydrolase/phosphomutase